MMVTELNTPIEKLNYVGPKYVKKLHRVDVETVRDLLFYFPHRYKNFNDITSINKIEPNKKITIQGQVKSIENTKSPKRKMPLTKALVEDKTGAIEAVWFNQPYLKKTLKEGSVVNLSGKIKLERRRLIYSNPAYEVVKKPNENTKKTNYIHTGTFVPVYPETKGLTSRYLRFLIDKNLKAAEQIPERLPEDVLSDLNLMQIEKAIKQIHFPSDEKTLKQAKKRLTFEEIFYIQLLLQQKKKTFKKRSTFSISFQKQTTREFVSDLPYELTDAQRKAAWEIIQDITTDSPMRRLLEGEVGSGKTVVASIAILNVTENKFQTAFMAPTEILAFQHFEQLKKDLSNFNVKISLFTGSKQKLHHKGKEENISRSKLLNKIEKNEVDLTIGTHTLIQDEVEFKNLALTIVDEQHRFGIKQRGKLLKKTDADTKKTATPTATPAIRNKRQETKNKKTPHLLSMTATPIPRTLSLALYGDLDISKIDELPQGRKKVKTKLVSPDNRNSAYQFIKKQIEKGRQAFIICPLIEESDKLESKSAQQEYEKLSQDVYPNLNIGLLHGRLKSQQKKEIMQKFKQGRVDILVSTSVIEVGVDVPNATCMVIEGAERFGLAQLHQFRGRVGRSQYQSYCLLFTDSPSPTTRKRLKALVELNDGFKLAEKDLEIRGPGDFIGTRQAGEADLAMASLGDIELIKKAKRESKKIIKRDPKLSEHPKLKEKIDSLDQKAHLE